MSGPGAPRSAYLSGYPEDLAGQVGALIESGQLARLLLRKYPEAHSVRTDAALYDYVQDLRNSHLRHAGQLSKVTFDSKLRVMQQALGTHTQVSRVQGGKLKAKREIRIASVFRDMPLAFLRMIVVHELAHLKEMNHDKAFYQLCRYMEPDYHQLEFDLRAYLCHLEVTGQALWQSGAQVRGPA